MVLESSQRSLTAAERRLLDAKIRDLQARVSRGPKAALTSIVVVAILWILTLVASDVPWPIVTSFWIVVGAGLYLWVRRDLLKDLDVLRDMLRGYESARRRDQAEVFEVRSSAFAELEEVEDEGACYVFQIDDDRLVSVAGQEFYPQARFPSHDFSLVHILDERDQPVEMVIEKRGSQAAPARIIPAATKLRLEIPAHLEVIEGALDQIEDLLGSTGQERA